MLAVALFDWLYETLGAVMSFFYSIVPSYAFAIALLTITVRMLLIPLTQKQVKSQRAMQQLQPELKKLQAKYKGDRQKLNEEMMKLYKEHKANPLAGCLPLVLQMPLFIILYRLIISLSKQPPRHIPMGSALYDALVASGGKLQSLGMDLAEKPQTVIGLILVALVVATGYYQQKQMTARMPKDAINPQMQMVTKVFPAFFGLISLSVPTGVVVYFVVSNLWQIGQQAVAFRSRERARVAEEGDEPPPPAKAGGKSDGSGAGGGSGSGSGSGSGGPKAVGSGGKGGGGGGSAAKSGGPTAKSGGPKSGGAAPKGGSPKGGGPKTRSGGGTGGGGASRPPSGRVTPKGGPAANQKAGKASATPAKPTGSKASSPKTSGSGSANAKSGASKSGASRFGASKFGASKFGASKSSTTSASSDGESLWSRLSPMNRAAKAQRPPPAARPKGLPPTKGSSGGSSRKEP
ncbi:MAG: YidC/Oxa1 family rane protein insertase [Actinomycetota bacterium]|jgi:YidC/Oxa1 family membrane protein insertase|nr:YidC/Oxa1 family rane protein insertase [Actinomycetota bacterium]